MAFMTIAAAFLLLAAGATLKGVIGVGLPMIAIPGLALLFGLPSALAIVSFPVLAANLWQVRQFRTAARRGTVLIRFLALGGCGTVLGTLVLVSVPEATLKLILAVMLVAYIVLRIYSPDMGLDLRRARVFAGPSGLVAGLLHGSTGISGPVVITFFHAQQSDRPQFIFATGAVFAGFTAVQIPVLALTGVLDVEILALGLAGLPAITLGLRFGNLIARHVDKGLFDRLVLVVLGWTAVVLFWQGATGVFRVG